ncbi:uncharacterized protein LTR77_005842 [Saxophila tyrrhenica]|uniref:Uncharacterized protein n=1 Tax=Saxophila tyrrhenica TaxID=1690608 RepID=A0AAV9PCN4_9PEZI|nr:hypothetical protein LTR77_005842 [Saxophila tyrrhenica]
MADLSQVKPCVIFPNGFPGVGKLTIARSIEEKLQHFRISSRLVDTHLLDDAAKAIHPSTPRKGSDNVQQAVLLDRLRMVVLKELKTLPTQNTVIIINGGLSMEKCDVAVFADYVDVARARGIPFYAFTIACELEEHLTRVRTASRWMRMQLTIAELYNVSRKNRVLDPTDESVVGRFDKVVKLRHRVVDTTDLSVYASSERVLGAIVAEQ